MSINADKIRRCPRAGGYILAATHDNAMFTEWMVGGVFVGLIERAAGKLPIYHRACPVCGGGHYFAIGTSPALEDLTPARHDTVRMQTAMNGGRAAT
jgi:ribosomal protein S27AE